MKLFEGLVLLLRQTPGVHNLVSDRVHPMVLPQKPTYPAVTYGKQGANRDHTMQGPSGTSTTRIQLDVYAPRYSDVAAVAEQLRLALDGYQGTMGNAGGVEVDSCFLEFEDDGYDDDLKVYSKRLDFELIHADA